MLVGDALRAAHAAGLLPALTVRAQADFPEVLESPGGVGVSIIIRVPKCRGWVESRPSEPGMISTTSGGRPLAPIDPLPARRGPFNGSLRLLSVAPVESASAACDPILRTLCG
jgi:hypothetical protein